MVHSPPEPAGGTSRRRAAQAPRSLADELRGRDDEALADLLAMRPDLAVPLPPDIGSLATAAAGRLSVQRAVDGLETPALQVLEVLASMPEPATAADVGRRWGATAREPLERLRVLGLVWGTPRALRLVRAARDALGPYPAGLGPPLADALDRRSPQRLADLLDDLGLPPTGDPEEALRRLAAHLSDPGTVEKLLSDAPEGARELLARLTWGPPVGRVADADRPVRAAGAASPVDWLLAHGLLAVADPGHVVLPREVAMVLRGGTVHASPSVAPPPLPVRDRPAASVDGTAAGAAAEAVRLVEELGRLWGGELGSRWAGGPPPVLRAGGLGVRDLRRTAQALEVDDATAALVVELAAAGGLIADDGEADPGWLPSRAFDDWVEEPVGDRWARLVATWWALPRAPGVVGGRDQKDSPIAALSAEVERPLALEVRQRVLTELAALPARGARPALPAGPAAAEALTALLDWWSPRRAGRLRRQLVEWTLREAAWLGVTGAGALARPALELLRDATPGALLPAGSGEAAADALDALLPDPVDHVLLQADLTAVAPGPLVPDLARELGLAADVESRGGATVYRFAAGSVRRALDAGRTGEDLLRLLAAHSRTPVPQPLEYLVTDTARRYGRLRVGAASAYLRAEDESVLDELLADRRAAPLRLRRLAPTVLAAQAAPDAVLALLRELGLAPAAESAEGDLVVRRPDARRAAGRARRQRAWPPPVPARDDLLAAVRRVRAQAVASDDAPTATDPSVSLALIRDAVTSARPVWITYLAETDRPQRSLVRPLSIEAGRVRAQDVANGRMRSFSAHRIIGVTPSQPSSA